MYLAYIQTVYLQNFGDWVDEVRYWLKNIGSFCFQFVSYHFLVLLTVRCYRCFTRAVSLLFSIVSCLSSFLWMLLFIVLVQFYLGCIHIQILRDMKFVAYETKMHRIPFSRFRLLFYFSFKIAAIHVQLFVVIFFLVDCIEYSTWLSKVIMNWKHK